MSATDGPFVFEDEDAARPSIHDESNNVIALQLLSYTI